MQRLWRTCFYFTYLAKGWSVEMFNTFCDSDYIHTITRECIGRATSSVSAVLPSQSPSGGSPGSGPKCSPVSARLGVLVESSWAFGIWVERRWRRRRLTAGLLTQTWWKGLNWRVYWLSASISRFWMLTPVVMFGSPVVKGEWENQIETGYTLRGIYSSGFGLNCPQKFQFIYY